MAFKGTFLIIRVLVEQVAQVSSGLVGGGDGEEHRLLHNTQRWEAERKFRQATSASVVAQKY